MAADVLPDRFEPCAALLLRQGERRLERVGLAFDVEGSTGTVQAPISS